MALSFTNRVGEMKELDSAANHGELLVLFGRRRVGKTPLLIHWLAPRKGLYSQAIEGAKETKLEQVFQDLHTRLSTSIVPKNWAELFKLFSLQKQRIILCLDESALELAEELLFGFAPYLDQEPGRILRDEGISGANAVSFSKSWVVALRSPLR